MIYKINDKYNYMKINDIINETTSAGGIAVVAAPLFKEPIKRKIGKSNASRKRKKQKVKSDKQS